jgi:hypothetical protein
MVREISGSLVAALRTASKVKDSPSGVLTHQRVQCRGSNSENTCMMWPFWVAISKNV